MSNMFNIGWSNSPRTYELVAFFPDGTSQVMDTVQYAVPRPPAFGELVFIEARANRIRMGANYMFSTSMITAYIRRQRDNSYIANSATAICEHTHPNTSYYTYRVDDTLDLQPNTEYTYEFVAFYPDGHLEVLDTKTFSTNSDTSSITSPSTHANRSIPTTSFPGDYILTFVSSQETSHSIEFNISRTGTRPVEEGFFWGRLPRSLWRGTDLVHVFGNGLPRIIYGPVTAGTYVVRMLVDQNTWVDISQPVAFTPNPSAPQQVLDITNVVPNSFYPNTYNITLNQGADPSNDIELFAETTEGYRFKVSPLSGNTIRMVDRTLTFSRRRRTQSGEYVEVATPVTFTYS